MEPATDPRHCVTTPLLQSLPSDGRLPIGSTGKPMRVFAVGQRYMGVVNDCGAFANREAAERHANSLNGQGNPEVIESPVFGGTEGQLEVFVAYTYDPGSDLH